MNTPYIETCISIAHEYARDKITYPRMKLLFEETLKDALINQQRAWKEEVEKLALPYMEDFKCGDCGTCEACRMYDAEQTKSWNAALDTVLALTDKEDTRTV